MPVEEKQKNKRKKMRNPNGFGSVYKLSGRRRKPWIARITVGWEIVVDKKTGKEKEKQIYQTIGYYEEKGGALDALVLQRKSPIVPKADITLKELYEEWSKIKYENIEKTTKGTYEASWIHLSKYGDEKFKELRTTHFQTVIDVAHKAGKSRSTMEKIKAVSTMLYNYAIQNDIVNKSYAKFIVLPKEEKEEKEIFTDLEIKALEKNAETVEWVDTILILIYSGMRISEMLELTKFSINLEKQTITGGLKTEAGKNRVIPIHPKIYRFIKKWYDKNGNYLICNEKGKKVTSDNYRKKKYYRTLETLKIRQLNPHCCRHTFASLLAKAGVKPLYIQRMLGHKKYSFTADNYTHTDVEELAKAINTI